MCLLPLTPNEFEPAPQSMPRITAAVHLGGAPGNAPWAISATNKANSVATAMWCLTIAIMLLLLLLPAAAVYSSCYYRVTRSVSAWLLRYA
jgi:hypothetical protein